MTQKARNDFNAMSRGMADKPLEHIFESKRKSKLVEHLSEYAICDPLAVDQNSVAVEDDEFKSWHIDGATGDRIAGKASVLKGFVSIVSGRREVSGLAVLLVSTR